MLRILVLGLVCGRSFPNQKSNLHSNAIPQHCH
jgi:hypothetical protein